MPSPGGARLDRRGRAALRPRQSLIIDGSFQSQPAVRHKEILWALSRGIPVIGAASMGALRAAELYPSYAEALGSSIDGIAVLPLRPMTLWRCCMDPAR